jgi:hypothetical protein
MSKSSYQSEESNSEEVTSDSKKIVPKSGVEHQIHDIKGKHYLVSRTSSGTKIFPCNLFGEPESFMYIYSFMGSEPMDESIRKFKETLD